MSKSGTFNYNADVASIYDDIARRCWSHSAEIIFGLLYEWIEPGQRMLDIGIGTGLSVRPFLKAGLSVHGLDNAEAMLARCRETLPCKELLLHDLTQFPYPFPDRHFQVVTCIGVFHFIKDLYPVLAEAARLLPPDGVFGFTYAVRPLTLDKNSTDVIPGRISTQTDPESGTRLYAHSETYLERGLQRAGFHLEKQTDFLASKADTPEKNVYMRAVTAKRS